MKTSNLTMKSEFGATENSEISGYDIANDENATHIGEVKVYDVILAGVSK